MAQGGVPIWPKSQGAGPIRDESALKNFSIPAKFGRVRIAKFADSNRTLIHIEDAHDSFEAQKKIVSILGILASDYDVRTIALEGGAGEMDTALFKTYPDQAVAKKTAENLVKEGRLNAGEFFALTSETPISVYGAEEKTLYRENLKAFRDLLKRKDLITSDVQGLSKSLEVLGERVYSKTVKEIHRNKALSLEEEKGFTRRWDFLKSLAEAKNISLGSKKELRILQSVADLEKEIDFTKANSRRQKLLEIFREKLSKADSEELILKSLAFKSGKLRDADYYLLLSSLALRYGLDPTEYSDLAHYTDYLALFDSLDLSKVFDEIAEFEDEVRSTYFLSEDERILWDLERRWEVLKDVVSGTASSSQVGSFSREPKRFRRAEFIRGLRRLLLKHHVPSYGGMKPKKIFDAMPLAERFYRLAEKRNQVILERTLARMKAENKQVAALVTGGYHTRGISELLGSQDLSYLVIMPKITDPKSSRPYITVITRQKEEYAKALGADSSRFQVVSGAPLYKEGGNPLARLKDLLEPLTKGLSAAKLSEWMGAYRASPDRKLDANKVESSIEEVRSRKLEVGSKNKNISFASSFQPLASNRLNAARLASADSQEALRDLRAKNPRDYRQEDLNLLEASINQLVLSMTYDESFRRAIAMKGLDEDKTTSVFNLNENELAELSAVVISFSQHSGATVDVGIFFNMLFLSSVILDVLAHEKFGQQKKSLYEKSRILLQSTAVYFKKDAAFLSQYATALYHAGFNEQSLEVFEEIEDEEDTRAARAGRATVLLRFARRIVFAEMEETLKNNQYDLALSLRQKILDQVSGSERLLMQNIAPYLRGQKDNLSQVARSFANLADLSMFRSKIHTVFHQASQAESGLARTANYAILALDQAAMAYHFATESVLVDASNPKSQQVYVRIAGGMAQALQAVDFSDWNYKEAQGVSIILKRVQNDLRRASDLDNAVMKSKTNLVLKPAWAGLQAEADDFEESKTLLAKTIETVAIHDFADVETFLSQVKRSVISQADPVKQDKIIAYTKLILRHLQLETEDLAILKAYTLVGSAKNLDLIAEYARMEAETLTTKEILGRFDRQVYKFLDYQLAPALEAESKEPTGPPKAPSSEGDYDKRTLKSVMDQDLRKLADLRRLYASAASWLDAKESADMQFQLADVETKAGKFKLQAQVIMASSKKETGPLSGLTLARRGASYSIGYWSEMERLEKRLKRKVTMAAKEIGRAMDVVSAYRSQTLQLQGRFKLQFLVEINKGLESVLSRMKELLAAHNEGDTYLSRSALETLLAEAVDLFDQTGLVKNHRERLETLNDLLISVKTKIERLDRLLRNNFGNKLSDELDRFQDRFANLAFDRRFEEKAIVLQNNLDQMIRWLDFTADLAQRALELGERYTKLEDSFRRHRGAVTASSEDEAEADRLLKDIHASVDRLTQVEFHYPDVEEFRQLLELLEPQIKADLDEVEEILTRVVVRKRKAIWENLRAARDAVLRVKDWFIKEIFPNYESDSSYADVLKINFEILEKIFVRAEDLLTAESLQDPSLLLINKEQLKSFVRTATDIQSMIRQEARDKAEILSTWVAKKIRDNHRAILDKSSKIELKSIKYLKAGYAYVTVLIDKNGYLERLKVRLFQSPPQGPDHKEPEPVELEDLSDDIDKESEVRSKSRPAIFEKWKNFAGINGFPFYDFFRPLADMVLYYVLYYENGENKPLLNSWTVLRAAYEVLYERKAAEAAKAVEASGNEPAALTSFDAIGHADYTAELKEDRIRGLKILMGLDPLIPDEPDLPDFTELIHGYLESLDKRREVPSPDLEDGARLADHSVIPTDPARWRGSKTKGSNLSLATRLSQTTSQSKQVVKERLDPLIKERLDPLIFRFSHEDTQRWAGQNLNQLSQSFGREDLRENSVQESVVNFAWSTPVKKSRYENVGINDDAQYDVLGALFRRYGGSLSGSVDFGKTFGVTKLLVSPNEPVVSQYPVFWPSAPWRPKSISQAVDSPDLRPALAEDSLLLFAWRAPSPNSKRTSANVEGQVGSPQPAARLADLGRVELETEGSSLSLSTSLYGQPQMQSRGDLTPSPSTSIDYLASLGNGGTPIEKAARRFAGMNSGARLAKSDFDPDLIALAKKNRVFTELGWGFWEANGGLEKVSPVVFSEALGYVQGSLEEYLKAHPRFLSDDVIVVSELLIMYVAAALDINFVLGNPLAMPGWTFWLGLVMSLISIGEIVFNMKWLHQKNHFHIMAKALRKNAAKHFYPAFVRNALGPLWMLMFHRDERLRALAYQINLKLAEVVPDTPFAKKMRQVTETFVRAGHIVPEKAFEFSETPEIFEEGYDWQNLKSANHGISLDQIEDIKFMHVRGMSVLYSGRLVRDGRQVVIKISRPGAAIFKIVRGAHQIPYSEFLLHEIKVMEDISRYPQASKYLPQLLGYGVIPDDSAFVRLFHWNDAPGRSYLIEEKIAGENLKDKAERFIESGVAGNMTQEPLSAMIINDLLSVATALKALHSHGIVHRDLGAEEIFPLPDGEVKFTDFGLSATPSVGVHDRTEYVVKNGVVDRLSHYWMYLRSQIEDSFQADVLRDTAMFIVAAQDYLDILGESSHFSEAVHRMPVNGYFGDLSFRISNETIDHSISLDQIIDRLTKMKTPPSAPTRLPSGGRLAEQNQERGKRKEVDWSDPFRGITRFKSFSSNLSPLSSYHLSPARLADSDKRITDLIEKIKDEAEWKELLRSLSSLLPYDIKPTPKAIEKLTKGRLTARQITAGFLNRLKVPYYQVGLVEHHAFWLPRNHLVRFIDELKEPLPAKEALTFRMLAKSSGYAFSGRELKELVLLHQLNANNFDITEDEKGYLPQTKAAWVSLLEGASTTLLRVRPGIRPTPEVIADWTETPLTADRIRENMREFSISYPEIGMVRDKLPHRSTAEWKSYLSGLARKLPSGAKPTVANLTLLSDGDLRKSDIYTFLNNHNASADDLGIDIRTPAEPKSRDEWIRVIKEAVSSLVQAGTDPTSHNVAIALGISRDYFQKILSLKHIGYKIVGVRREEKEGRSKAEWEALLKAIVKSLPFGVEPLVSNIVHYSRGVLDQSSVYGMIRYHGINYREVGIVLRKKTYENFLTLTQRGIVDVRRKAGKSASSSIDYLTKAEQSPPEQIAQAAFQALEQSPEPLALEAISQQTGIALDRLTGVLDKIKNIIFELQNAKTPPHDGARLAGQKNTAELRKIYKAHQKASLAIREQRPDLWDRFLGRYIFSLTSAKWLEMTLVKLQRRGYLASVKKAADLGSGTGWVVHAFQNYTAKQGRSGTEKGWFSWFRRQRSGNISLEEGADFPDITGFEINSHLLKEAEVLTASLASQKLLDVKKIHWRTDNFLDEEVDLSEFDLLYMYPPVLQGVEASPGIITADITENRWWVESVVRRMKPGALLVLEEHPAQNVRQHYLKDMSDLEYLPDVGVFRKKGDMPREALEKIYRSEGPAIERGYKAMDLGKVVDQLQRLPAVPRRYRTETLQQILTRLHPIQFELAGALAEPFLRRDESIDVLERLNRVTAAFPMAASLLIHRDLGLNSKALEVHIMKLILLSGMMMLSDHQILTPGLLHRYTLDPRLELPRRGVAIVLANNASKELTTATDQLLSRGQPVTLGVSSIQWPIVKALANYVIQLASPPTQVFNDDVENSFLAGFVGYVGAYFGIEKHESDPRTLYNSPIARAVKKLYLTNLPDALVQAVWREDKAAVYNLAAVGALILQSVADELGQETDLAASADLFARIAANLKHHSFFRPDLFPALREKPKEAGKASNPSTDQSEGEGARLAIGVRSYAVRQEIVRALLNRPDIRVVRVGGRRETQLHTLSRLARGSQSILFDETRLDVKSRAELFNQINRIDLSRQIFGLVIGEIIPEKFSRLPQNTKDAIRDEILRLLPTIGPKSFLNVNEVSADNVADAAKEIGLNLFGGLSSQQSVGVLSTKEPKWTESTPYIAVNTLKMVLDPLFVRGIENRNKRLGESSMVIEDYLYLKPGEVVSEDLRSRFKGVVRSLDELKNFDKSRILFVDRSDDKFSEISAGFQSLFIKGAYSAFAAQNAIVQLLSHHGETPTALLPGLTQDQDGRWILYLTRIDLERQFKNLYLTKTASEQAA